MRILRFSLLSLIGLFLACDYWFGSCVCWKCETPAQAITVDRSIELRELGAGELLFPEGMVINEEGVLFVADKGHHRVVKIVSDQDQPITIAGNGEPGLKGIGGPALQAQLCFPESVAGDLEGNLYIADTFNSRISRLGPDGRITTVAGTEDIGDGGRPESADLSLVGSLVADGDTLYITDTGHHRIRAVDFRRGTIRTVAGSGAPGFSGDGGSALRASLFRPEFIWLDAHKNLYIADTFNNRVRKVNRRGIISTIAGTGEPGYNGDGILADQAQLFSPEGITTDKHGNVFVADMGNDRLRRIDARTRMITTVAGTGESGFNGDGRKGEDTQLNFPLALAYDQKREALFISDKFNQRIRKLDLRTNLISSVAGTGVPGSSGDNISATKAELFNPEGILLDDSGNLYIADQTNNLVRRVNAASGKISTIAGTGESGFSGDGGQARSASLFSPNRIAMHGSRLYLAEGNIVREIDLKSGLIRSVAGSRIPMGEGPARQIRLSLPSGLAVFKQYLYVCDTGHHQVLKISLKSWKAEVVIGNGHPGRGGDDKPSRNAQLSLPQSLAFDGLGNLYIADAGNNRIRLVDGSNSIARTVLASGLEDFDKGSIPEVAARSLLLDVKVASDGMMLIADVGNGRVRRADLSRGTVTTIAGPPERTLKGEYVPLLPITLDQPKRIAIDNKGALFISENTGHRILKLSF